MRWVNDTFPPRVRDRWLFRILRLTSSIRAGTTRKLVAVGTVRLASMFWTMRAPAPRMGWAPGGRAAGTASGAASDVAAAGLASALAAGLASAVAGVEPLPPCFR